MMLILTEQFSDGIFDAVQSHHSHIHPTGGGYPSCIRKVNSTAGFSLEMFEVFHGSGTCCVCVCVAEVNTTFV